ncbi:hypothetical protein [Gemelliphila palaticanis]|uniref:Uncharacterized protein n=1 Tax=Gemelliphila palaticanis TaxID=81950 RepID=A0ABX2T0D0_9BACL|nr:hypothetical protein [Gemella palaticanis]MBF0715153.1 hypothetical protein [Gemella palaticanis]NYS47083.1 hypothetical protein [Gemella palaticanis]
MEHILNFDAANLSNLFLVSIILPVFIFFYIISCLSTFFVFKTLNIKSYLAFIPIYSTYRNLKEYKGRVYKSNWGKLYLIAIVLLLISILLFTIGGLSINFGIIIIGAVLVFVSSIMFIVISFVRDFPIMYKHSLKLAYVILFILSFFNSMIVNIFNNINTMPPISVGDEFTLYSNIFFSVIGSLIMPIYIIVVSYIMYRKVRYNTAEVVEKIELEKLENYEVEKLLYLREKSLIRKK